MSSRLQELTEMLVGLEAQPVEAVELGKVNIDMRYYPRESYDFEGRVALFAESLENGIEFPPIVLAQDGITVIDGAHRTLAHRQAGRKEIKFRRLPVSEKTDIMALSILTNSPSLGMPLKKNDLRRVLNLIITTLDEQYGDPREGIKQYAASMESMARYFQVPVTAIQKITAMIEGIKGGRAESKALPQAKSRAEYRTEPDTSPWGREAAPLPESVVHTVLATPSQVVAIPQQTPWDYLLQATLRTLRAFVDLSGDDDWALRLSEAYVKLPPSDKEFLMHYRARLDDLSAVLRDMREE